MFWWDEVLEVLRIMCVLSKHSGPRIRPLGVVPVESCMLKPKIIDRLQIIDFVKITDLKKRCRLSRLKPIKISYITFITVTRNYGETLSSRLRIQL